MKKKYLMEMLCEWNDRKKEANTVCYELTKWYKKDFLKAWKKYLKQKQEGEK